MNHQWGFHYHRIHCILLLMVYLSDTDLTFWAAASSLCKFRYSGQKCSFVTIFKITSFLSFSNFATKNSSFWGRVLNRSCYHPNSSDPHESRLHWVLLNKDTLSGCNGPFPTPPTIDFSGMARGRIPLNRSYSGQSMFPFNAFDSIVVWIYYRLLVLSSISWLFYLLREWRGPL